MAKPASITTGRIVAQYVVGVVDGADADDEPDFIPAQGSVTFETTVGYIPFPVVSGPNPLTVLKTRITGILDDEGYLCTPDPGDKTKPGARGLRLVSTDNEVASVQGWTWIATPRFVDVNGSRLDNAIPPFPFHLPAQGPEDPPLDLATVVKVPASVGIGTVQAVALAASAQAAAVSAEASAEVAVSTALDVQRRADEGEFNGREGEQGPAGPNTVPTQEAVADYISTPGNPTNGALERLYRTAVTPSEFGAVGDGVADDYAALQAGLDSALARKLAFQFDGRTYAVSKTLLYGSQEVGGVFASTRIRQTTPGRPVMASASWGGRPGPHGRAYVHDLILEGESADPNSHGLVMRDYYSKLERIRVANAGGHGIYVTPFSSAGEATAGTLVDNVFKDLQARNCKGWGILLGEAHNNKLTDGYASELFVSCAPNAMGGILIGSAAGWKLNSLHTYGGSCPVAVSIFNGYWTDINGLYLEDNWTSTGLLFSSVQQGVTVDHITVKIPADAISPTALKVESRSLAYQDAAVNIGSLMVRHSGTGPATAIGLESDTTSVAVDNLSVLGAGKGRVTKYGGFEGGRIRRISDAIIESPIRDTPARVSLAVNGIPLGLAMTARWVGGGPQTVVLPLPELQTYQVVHATLSLGSAGNYNGGVRARWRSDLVVASKAASDPWSVYPADILPPTGLTGTPLIAVDRAAKQMTVTFTPSAADGYGYVSLTMEYA